MIDEKAKSNVKDGRRTYLFVDLSDPEQTLMLNNKQ